MIVSFFILSCFTRSTADFNERKFVSGTKHFNYHWEYGGYTNYNATNNHFELVPGDRYSEGFVYFSNRLPRSEWSIRTVFEFFLDSQLNQFGIWITSRFGQTGEVFGGPSSFTGVAVLFKFSSGKLAIEIRQNNGNETYRPIVFIPQFSKELTRPKISLNISYSNNETLNILLKLHSNKIKKSDSHQKNFYGEKNDNNSKINEFNINEKENENQEFLIFNEKPIVSLSHFWFGVTSYNPKDGKPLYLNSIRVNGLKNKFNATKIEKTENPKLIQFLNQTSINEMSFKYYDVIEYIEALVNISNKMLRQKLLTHFVRSQFIEFADSWQRRSLGATNDAVFLRGIVKNEMFLIEEEISSLSRFVWESFKKFRGELNELTEELIEFYENDSFIKDKKKYNENNLNSFLLYIGLFEIIVLLTVGPIMLNHRVKSKVFEIEEK